MKKRVYWLVGFVCLLPLLVGCGATSGGSASASHKLTITRINTLPSNVFPAFVKNIDDAAGATRLYDAMKALPLAKGVYSCPLDNGLRYQLDFSLDAVPARQIIVDGSGCRMISLSKADARMTNTAFWSLFAQIAGLSESDLFPPPLSS